MTITNVGTVRECCTFSNKLIANVLEICIFDMEIKIPPKGPEKLNLEVSQKLICMSKVRNLAEIAPNIGFTEFDFYALYRSTIEKSELDRIKKLLPLLRLG